MLQLQRERLSFCRPEIYKKVIQNQTKSSPVKKDVFLMFAFFLFLFYLRRAWKSFKQLLDNKRLSRDFIGHIRLPISSLKDSNDLWFDLLCKHGDPSHNVRAKVKLRINFKFENVYNYKNKNKCLPKKSFAFYPTWKSNGNYNNEK